MKNRRTYTLLQIVFFIAIASPSLKAIPCKGLQRLMLTIVMLHLVQPTFTDENNVVELSPHPKSDIFQTLATPVEENKVHFKENSIPVSLTKIEIITEGSAELNEMGFSEWEEGKIEAQISSENQKKVERRNLQGSLSTTATCYCECNNWIRRISFWFLTASIVALVLDNCCMDKTYVKKIRKIRKIRKIKWRKRNSPT